MTPCTRMSLTLRKKIYRYCIKENRTILHTARLLEIPSDVVRKFIYVVFSDHNQRIKVMATTDRYVPPTPKLRSKFTGYITELTEDDIERLCHDGVLKNLDYKVEEVTKERFHQHSEARSYKERLIEKIEWNGTHKSIEDQMKYIRKLNNINKPDDRSK